MTSFQHFTSVHKEDIPTGFIEFNNLDIGIDNQQMNTTRPIYLSVDNIAETSRLSDVCIDQESDTGVIKHIAYFYNRYSYTKAFKAMLEDESNLNYYRLFIKL